MSKKMQRYTVYFIWKLFYIFRLPPTHHQERKQLYLQHLVFVTPLLFPAVIVEEFQLQPDAVDTVVCAPDDGRLYHPKHVEQFPDKINSLTLHLVRYTGILEYY
jgi:hypothetical protein